MSQSILVVDGDRGMRDLITLHLTNAGYEVTAAPDAILAGRRLLRAAPDLLVVDADLPYLSGVEFLATIVADSSLPYVPAILLASRDSLAPRADALGVPCLVKPFFVDRLVNLVQQQLQARPDLVRRSALDRLALSA